jgi:hypothetical protein
MRIIFGLLLITIAIVWAAFWSAGAAMTTETGIWNSMTWAVMAVAGLALIPFAAGIYLIVRAMLNLGRPRGKADLARTSDFSGF